MANQKQSKLPEGGALVRGAVLAVGVWLGGVLALAGGIALGLPMEGFLSLAVLTAMASFAGGCYAARGGGFSGALGASAVFALSLAAAGLALWQRVAWNGHGGLLLLWAAGGGILAGLLGTPRKKRSRRRIYTRAL